MVKHKEIKVGIFSAVALTLLYFGFNYLKGVDFFQRKKIYYAVYDDINQLAISNSVFLNGVTVGRVSNAKILPEKHNHVLVELEIDSDIQLTDDTKAILNSELLGGKSVILHVNPLGKVLNQYDTIKTEVAKGMFDMFSETATPVATDLQTTLRKFSTTIDVINKTFEDLDVVLVRLKNTPYQLNKTLATANDNIAKISNSIQTDAETLNVVLNDLKPTLANFKTLSDSLKRLQLNQTLSKVQQTMTTLNESLAKLKKHDNTMGRLFTEDSVYVNLNKLLVDLDKLSNHLNTTPKDFLSPLGKSKKKVAKELREAEENKRAAAKK